jgi:hypothetical protein
VRRDAPVLPDCTPANLADDSDNPPAQFTRGYDADPNTPGIQPIVVPRSSFNQKGISIGRDPTDTTSVTNRQIRAVIPELPDDPDNRDRPVPAGVYVPNDGARMLGGIFVQGDLTSLTLHADGDLARYVFVYSDEQRVTQTVTVIVDRANNRTTVTHSDWDPITRGNQSGTRTFSGVPKGFQGPGHPNAAIVYVNGNIGGLSGTLEEKEQTTIVARERIDIVGHVLYERPPSVQDPNPLNVLGLFSERGDIRILSDAPPDLVLHAVMMAGQPGRDDGHNSVVFVEGWNTISPRGAVHLIGGMIQERYGAFGTFNPVTGAPVTGYGRNFRFDRRMERGLSPPYFPTTGIPQIHAHGLAGVRPQWHEGSPP